mmetsp:Transcript_9571/g.19251  ORF Transcript_9571/g.19251 Transcript_9571/m.19251 type:complete len:273 (+) Transcript_9571:130-948(+)
MSSSLLPAARAALKTSLAVAASGKAWPTSSPRPMASLTSFCWCFSGKAGAKSPSSILGPLSEYMGQVSAPSLMTSMMSEPWSPPFVPRASPSLRATMLMPMTMLTTSFMRAPQPTSPRKKVRLPRTSKHGCASSCRALSPAVRMTSCPCSAGPLEPLTGASRKRPPLAVTASPISLDVASSTVDMSTKRLPEVMPASTPPSPKTTALAEAGSEVQARIRSHASTRACGVLATLAPFASRGAHLSLERFQTVTGKPASRRRPAMADPMMPMPM